MRKLIVLLSVFSFGLLLIGVPGLLTALRYREPVTVTDGTLVAWSMPKYIRLQQLRLQGLEAVQMSAERRGTRIYIPVRYQGDTPQGKINAVLASDDPALLDAVTRLGGKPSRAKSLAVLDAFARKTEATGMVEVAYEPELKRQLRALTPALAADFVIVSEGEHPTFGLPVLALSVALPMLALLYWIWTRRNGAPADPAAEPPILR